MKCSCHVLTFWSILINIKLCDCYTVVLNQYLSGCELVIFTKLSLLTCLYDCQATSLCMSVNYHTKLHLCVENLENSDGENCHFVKKSGYVYVNKDGTWNTVISQISTLAHRRIVSVCGRPPSHPHTTVLGNRWTEGGKAVYTCTTTGTSAISTCQQNSSWNDIGDFCNSSTTSNVPIVPTPTTATTSKTSTSFLSKGPTEITASSTSISSSRIQKTSLTAFSLTPTPPSVLPNTDGGVGVNGITSQRISLLTSSTQSTITSRMSSTQSSTYTSHFTTPEPQFTVAETQFTTSELQFTSTESQFTMSDITTSHLSPTEGPRTTPITSTWTTSATSSRSASASISLPLDTTSTQSALASTTSLPVTSVSSTSVECIDASAADCGALPYGDYQSCSGCGYYATCSPVGVSTRACFTGLVWDDTMKICTWTSTTCVGG